MWMAFLGCAAGWILVRWLIILFLVLVVVSCGDGLLFGFRTWLIGLRCCLGCVGLGLFAVYLVLDYVVGLALGVFGCCLFVFCVL